MSRRGAAPNIKHVCMGTAAFFRLAAVRGYAVVRLILVGPCPRNAVDRNAKRKMVFSFFRVGLMSTGLLQGRGILQAYLAPLKM